MDTIGCGYVGLSGLASSVKVPNVKCANIESRVGNLSVICYSMLDGGILHAFYSLTKQLTLKILSPNVDKLCRYLNMLLLLLAKNWCQTKRNVGGKLSNFSILFLNHLLNHSASKVSGNMKRHSDFSHSVIKLRRTEYVRCVGFSQSLLKYMWREYV